MLFGSKGFEDGCDKCGKWVGYHMASSVTMLTNAYLRLETSFFHPNLKRIHKFIYAIGESATWQTKMYDYCSHSLREVVSNRKH